MKKHVLVVDDESAVSDVLCLLLQGAGFTVSVARSVAEAEPILGQNPPDAVLLDVFLREESGLDFLPRFRKLHPRVPVVVLTGLGYDNSVINQAMERGATMYFSKDIHTLDIIPLLEKLIEDGRVPQGASPGGDSKGGAR